MPWDGELDFVAGFARNLEVMPELPLAPGDLLEEYSLQTTRIVDLLGLIAALPPGERPDALPWDDVLGPLWRRLFSRGDDISRYLMAGLWRRVLLDAGQLERYLRTLTALVASARNFYLFDEALELAREGREVAGGEASPALANLINTEGSVHYCLRDWDRAEERYGEALRMAEALPPGADWALVTLVREDLVGQEHFNLAEVCMEKANACDGEARSRWTEESARILARLEAMPLGPRFVRILNVPRAELALLRGEFAAARGFVFRLLEGQDLEGPYRYPLLATHHRLMARIAGREGSVRESYEWVRKALRIGVSHNYPMEEHLVLNEAFAVLGSLHEGHGERAVRYQVEDLVQLLEDKDWYTGRSHSRNVSSLAVRIGRVLNGSDKARLDLHLLETAGLVHDIGKLRVSWSLLNKVAPITTKERAILQGHSGHGEEILGSIGMPAVAAVVGQHHETYDGRGYPRGVRPALPGAIVGLCDVYQASVEPNRKYKKPKAPREALRELKELAGSRFDPLAVEALLRVQEM